MLYHIFVSHLRASFCNSLFSAQQMRNVLQLEYCLTDVTSCLLLLLCKHVSLYSLPKLFQWMLAAGTLPIGNHKPLFVRIVLDPQRLNPADQVFTRSNGCIWRTLWQLLV